MISLLSLPWKVCAKQVRSQVFRFGGANYTFRGKKLLFLLYVYNKFFRAQWNWGGIAPNAPVDTSLMPSALEFLGWSWNEAYIINRWDTANCVGVGLGYISIGCSLNIKYAFVVAATMTSCSTATKRILQILPLQHRGFRWNLYEQMVALNQTRSLEFLYQQF